jgi:hypothetical protein
VQTAIRQIYPWSEQIHIYGGEKSFRDNTHCPVRHGLRHLQCVPAGEETLHRMQFTGSEFQQELFSVCL